MKTGVNSKKTSVDSIVAVEALLVFLLASVFGLVFRYGSIVDALAVRLDFLLAACLLEGLQRLITNVFLFVFLHDSCWLNGMNC